MDEKRPTTDVLTSATDADSGEGQVYMSKDEAHLASLGYKQGAYMPGQARIAGR